MSSSNPDNELVMRGYCFHFSEEKAEAQGI
jgi:hypothetical protein